MGEAQDISPSLGAGGVPLCSEGNCPAYDGKRCKALGFSPDRICEPAVVRLARRDDDIRGDERRKLTEAVNAIRDEARRIEDERDEARAQLAAAQAENGRLRAMIEAQGNRIRAHVEALDEALTTGLMEPLARVMHDTATLQPLQDAMTAPADAAPVPARTEFGARMREHRARVEASGETGLTMDECGRGATADVVGWLRSDAARRAARDALAPGGATGQQVESEEAFRARDDAAVKVLVALVRLVKSEGVRRG